MPDNSSYAMGHVPAGSTKSPPATPITLIPDSQAGADHEYGAGRSYFVDLVQVAIQEHRVQQGIANAQRFGGRVGVSGELFGDRRFDGPENAMRRLAASAKLERYSITTTSGAVGWFPTAAPPYVSEIFAAAARAAGVLPDTLPRGDLPARGLSIMAGRNDTGATVIAQAAQNDAASSTDPASLTVTTPVALVEGQVDVSQQLADRADPAVFDAGVAGDLGRALAERVDIQILNGTGANGQTTGLLPASGVTSVTIATATQIGVIPKVYQLVSDTGTAFGGAVDLLLMHPRRIAWLANTHDAAGVFSPFQPPQGVRVVPVPSMPASLGGGTEDRVIALSRDFSASVFMTRPVISAYADVLSGTLQIRIQVRAYVACAIRVVKSIGVLSGAGLAAPTFS